MGFNSGFKGLIYPLPITIWCPNSSDTTTNDYGLDKPCQRVDTDL